MADAKRVTTKRRRWRDYRTAAGGRPIKDFIRKLPSDARVEVVAAMADVRKNGVRVAKHLRGSIYEVIADTRDLWIRILFAQEGADSQVLLALNAFEKKTNRTPPEEIELAEERLAKWQERGEAAKKARKKAKKRPR